MADESLATKGQENILVNVSEAEARSRGWLFDGTLSVGGNTAKATDWVTRYGEVTAGTPGTHKDYDLAVYSDDASFSPEGMILRPDPLPDGWKPDDALTDGTKFIGIRKGCGAIVKTRYADNSDNVLPNQLLSISTTAGRLAKVDVVPATTTMTNAEIIAAFKHLTSAVLLVTAVAEDVEGTDIIVTGQMI